MSYNNSQEGDALPCVSVNIVSRHNKIEIGAAVYSKSVQKLSNNFQNDNLYQLDLYDFCDNEQLSNLDCLLNQLGAVVLYLPEEYEQKKDMLSRKLNIILDGKELELVYLKRTSFGVSSDISTSLVKLVGKPMHGTNIAESERPIAFGCAGCLIKCLRLLDDESLLGHVEVVLKSLNTFMRLDTSAMEAINLFPKPDHPSQFGSLYGILNKCKTKMGSRLLERWLRQPLIDEQEINQRLDLVEVFKSNTIGRNMLRDGPLKAIPDLKQVISKFAGKKNAGLAELYRLYVFTGSVPVVINNLVELKESLDSGVNGASILDEKFIQPLTTISNKFSMYEKLVRHVIDFDLLPDLRVNSVHDPTLHELSEEMQELQDKAENILEDARSSYASFADVKLEEDPKYGFVLRTTKADDERELRRNYSKVNIISMLKNGLYFTVPQLVEVGERFSLCKEEYDEKQQFLVEKAIETATTYLPVVESVAEVISELDVLLAFATATALSPGEYVRPTILPMGSGRLVIENARHPCVELMDDVQFIPNNYDLVRGESNFQIVTGPNMGGKSTYIRGIGSIVLLAQIGMFVPAAGIAEISIVDCILARVGAGDAVQKGVSTFMAEMLESSVILKTATKNSLLIVDELGRGTSTFDGFGLAWAISHYIATQISCLCVFATHFHELTSLANPESKVAGVVNKHVVAHVDPATHDVVMLYQLAKGPCTKSFGVHVAVTAGFPEPIIECAKRKAECLEAVIPSSLEKSPLSVDAIDNKWRRVQSSLKSFSMMDEKVFQVGNVDKGVSVDTVGPNPPQFLQQMRSIFPVDV